MQATQFAIVAGAVSLLLAAAGLPAGQGRPGGGRVITNNPAVLPDPNTPSQKPHEKLSNPFRGKVDNVTPTSVVIVGDGGPTATFTIGPGTKILRDGKEIASPQMFKGEPILVSFTAGKTGGDGSASTIHVGNLPAIEPASEKPADEGRGERLKNWLKKRQ